MNKLFFVIITALFLLSLFSMAAEDGKICTDDNGKIYPCGGYAWKYPHDLNNREVVWKPGKAAFRNLIAGKKEQTFIPAPGFTWNKTPSIVRPNTLDELSVHWSPGQHNGTIIAGDVVGSFKPTPGYVWSSAKNLTVSWIPGMQYPGVPHIYASKVADGWWPQPGYEWQKDKDGKILLNLSPKWVAGTAYPDLTHDIKETVYPPTFHVVASFEEGMFIPESGYTWVGGGTEKRPDPQKIYRDKIQEQSRKISGFRSIAPSQAAAVVAIFMGVRELSKALETDIERSMASIHTVINEFRESRGSDHGEGGGGYRETRESLSSPGGHAIPE